VTIGSRLARRDLLQTFLRQLVIRSIDGLRKSPTGNYGDGSELTEVPLLLDLADVRLWFDVSGPSALLQGERVVERPILVAVHGGPGLDHTTLKGSLAPLEEHMQIIYYDQRGHGRSDRSTAESWNYRVWADDLRRLCDSLGLIKPMVLGSSFGGFIAMAYAALFPEHPGGIILTNTTGGRTDDAATVEMFRRLGGDEAGEVAARDFAALTERSADDFNRVCLPLYSAKPGYAEASRQMLARSIHTTEVNLHYFRNEARHFDPWTLLPKITCPVLILAGEDDPMCPIAIVENLASQLPASTTRLVRLPDARHAVFRDRPDLAFPAVSEFSQAIKPTTPDGGDDSKASGPGSARS
jgi:pimeloyl-ACP methyl ester carboxylesterase